MNLHDEINFNNVFVQQLYDKNLHDANIQINVLRLDRIHSVVSGNKWFKLKYHLHQAAENGFKEVATFGGAYSNHILATAYACNKQSLTCIGFIRGEEPKHYSQTLLDAKKLNMRLEFLSRDVYKHKQALISANPSLFFIPEGGYSAAGAKGAAEILQLVPQLSIYNYIVCAVGTGTMLAGVANASMPHQQCIGISVMKNNFSLQSDVHCLIHNEVKMHVEILHDFHFGGYAKHTNKLVDFMNKMYSLHNLPLDFVYTAKALYAVYHLAEEKYFLHNSNILFIHSGGLQGNRSLPQPQAKMLASFYSYT